MKLLTQWVSILTISAMSFSFSSIASTTTAAVDQLLDQYKSEGAKNFSATRGQALWIASVKGRRCSNCHTEDPTVQGQHQKTKKTISALAPSANSERFQTTKNIRKWLKRNCKWTFGRECSAQEKGDFLVWISQQ